MISYTSIAKLYLDQYSKVPPTSCATCFFRLLITSDVDVINYCSIESIGNLGSDDWIPISKTNKKCDTYIFTKKLLELI